MLVSPQVPCGRLGTMPGLEGLWGVGSLSVHISQGLDGCRSKTIFH